MTDEREREIAVTAALRSMPRFGLEAAADNLPAYYAKVRAGLIPARSVVLTTRAYRVHKLREDPFLVLIFSRFLHFSEGANTVFPGLLFW